MMQVPLFAFRDVDDGVEDAVLNVLRSKRYLMGPSLSAFEAALGAYQNIKHALGVANGTDALALSMLALGVGHGDRIVTVANAGGYSSFAAAMIGAIPVLADIDPITQQMDPASLQAVLNACAPVPKAIVVTHLYGFSAPLAELLSIADKKGIPVIEDTAQAMGALTNTGKKAGSSGAIGSFSFYPTKNLGACGDAGAIITNDDALVTRVRALRQYGWKEKYNASISHGRNSRMDDIQAAILNAKIGKLDAWNEERRAIWVRYKNAGGKTLPLVGRDDASFVAHLCVARTPARAAWQKKLETLGIATAVHYPIMDYEQPALKPILETPMPLPGTDESKGTVFTLPCFPGMTEDEINHICRALEGGIA